MPDVNERPQCPPGCGGSHIGTCRMDRVAGTAGHESLFPAASIRELISMRKWRTLFWDIVASLREASADIAFSMDASFRLIRPSFGSV